MNTPLPTVSRQTLAELLAALDEHSTRGAIIAAPPAGVAPPAQFSPVDILLHSADGAQTIAEGQFLQEITNLGWVLKLSALDDARRALHLADAPIAEACDGDDSDEANDSTLGDRGPLGWPIERLQRDFASLSLADRIRLAKHGGQPARCLIIRAQDRVLIRQLLNNPRLTADEVAAIAGQSGGEVAVLQRLAKSREWTCHSQITRNLLCNPRLPLTDAMRLLPQLPESELRRLAKAGRVRAALKAAIIKKISGGG